MSVRWYLVQAKTGQEALAAFNLRRQGYETFLPLTFKTVRHARKVRVEKAAYFPGYLFVAFDVERDRWRPIASTLGVLRLVAARERPSPAPAGVVEGLKAHADGAGVMDAALGLRAGDSVRVIQGPFADRRGLVSQLMGEDRVSVLIAMMNGEVAVMVPRGACAVV
jgi:transcriptional antiterminator RfaH